MEDQVRDAFFDDLRSLARNIEKGHQEVKTALDTDAESTEQLDNLRGVLSAAKSLKVWQGNLSTFLLLNCDSKSEM